MIGGLSQAKETQELCKKPNDIRGDTSVAGGAALTSSSSHTPSFKSRFLCNDDFLQFPLSESSLAVCVF